LLLQPLGATSLPEQHDHDQHDEDRDQYASVHDRSSRTGKRPPIGAAALVARLPVGTSTNAEPAAIGLQAIAISSTFGSRQGGAESARAYGMSKALVLPPGSGRDGASEVTSAVTTLCGTVGSRDS